MPQLDPIRTSKQNGGKPAVRFRPPPHRAQPRPQTHMDHRSRIMWIAVAAVMAIIVVAWLSLLSTGVLTPNGKSPSNPFQTVMESLRRAVANGVFQPKNSLDTASATERRLQELRSRVFPQFNEPAQ